MLDTVVTQAVNQTFPVIGRVIALQSGIIASQISGALIDMRVNVGDRVEKSQVIAAISRDRMQAERDRYAAAVARYRGVVATAKAEYEKKQREFKRLVRLKKSAAFSGARFEDLERDVLARKGSLEEKRGQLNESRAQLKRAEIDLADTEIKAPFPGVVSEKHTDVGTYLRIGDRIVTVINDRDVEIEADVPTERLRGIPIGTKVKARFTGGRVLNASIRAIVPQENIRTRTRPVRFKIETNGTRVAIAANQSVTVEMPVAAGNSVVTVHKDAIVRRGENAIIFRIEKGKPIRRLVTLGAAVGRRFIVLSGAKPGDQLVVRGNETLAPGAPVQIIDAAGG